MLSGQDGVACPGRLDHTRLHFKSRRGSGRCRQALRLPGEPKPGPQAPCGQLPLPGDPGQAGRRAVPPPRLTVPAAARVRASPRPRADCAYPQLYFGRRPLAGADGARRVRSGWTPPSGRVTQSPGVLSGRVVPRALNLGANGAASVRRPRSDQFPPGRQPWLEPVTPGPVAGREGAAARPLPDYETTPTSERGTTPASGWAGRGLRARPSRRSSARLSVRPSVRPSVHPSTPWSVLRAAAAGAGWAGVVLRLARLPLASAWAWVSPTAPPGAVGRGPGGAGATMPRPAPLGRPPGLAVSLRNSPTACVSCCPGSGAGRTERQPVTGQADPSGALWQ